MPYSLAALRLIDCRKGTSSEFIPEASLDYAVTSSELTQIIPLPMPQSLCQHNKIIPRGLFNAFESSAGKN